MKHTAKLVTIALAAATALAVVGTAYTVVNKKNTANGAADSTPASFAQGQAAGRDGGTEVRPSASSQSGVQGGAPSGDPGGVRVGAGTGGQAAGRRTGEEGGPAGAGAQGGAQGGARGGPAGAGGRAGTAVRVQPLSLGTVSNTVVVSGDVIARSQVSIYPSASGRIAELSVRSGDLIEAGQTVALIDPSRPGETYSKSPVVATVGGTVLSVPLSRGDTVGVQTAVAVVGDLSDLAVETFIPERFVTTIRRGLGAQVRFEAIQGRGFQAAVDEISPVLDPASRTLRVRLRFTRPDPLIRAGMFASVELVTDARLNVPVIPRSAVINTYGSWIAFVVGADNTAQRRVLTLGLENEELMEVLDGIKPGERVVTAGQNFLSDRDPVRIVQ